AAIIERDLLTAPEGRRPGGRHTQHFDARECQPRRRLVLRELLRIENVEAAGPAKADAPVTPAQEGARRELLALHALVTVIGLPPLRHRVVANQTRIAAEPEPAL